jgi:hypothetical protein
MREQVLARAAAPPQLPPNGTGAVAASPVAGGAGLTRRPPSSACSASVAAATTYAVQEQRLGDERARARTRQQRADRIQAVLAAPDARCTVASWRRWPGDRRRVRHGGRRRRGAAPTHLRRGRTGRTSCGLVPDDSVTPVSAGVLPAGRWRRRN